MVKRRVVLSGAAVAALVTLAGCEANNPVTPQNVEGTWVAASARYTNVVNESQWVDIVGTYGASITLTVAANGGATFSFNDGLGNTSTDNNSQLNIDGSTLVLGGVTYQAQRMGARLVLTDPNALFDFDRNGSKEAAMLTITLNRG